MADEKTDSAKRETPEYTPDELIEESRAILNCSSHVAVGALHGVEEEKLTAAEGKALVRKFLKREAASA